MGKLSRLLMMAVAVLGASMLLAACGGDDDEGGDTGTTAQKEDGGGGKEGGSITIAQTSQPDFLDPALSYTVNGWEPLSTVYTPLLTYRHASGKEGAEVIPGLAEDMPTVSDDKLTYELKLREGLKYSDGSPVKASDFEHAVKRLLNLESGGSGFFSPIEGVEEYIEGKKAEADISGIETDDKTGAITIKLAKPDATMTYVLALMWSAPVPSDTPFKNLTKNPPPGVGPYKITSSVPNREFVLEKNENFPGFEGVPKAKIDKITTKIIKNQSRQALQVLNNELDYMQDPPTADTKPQVREKASDRYEEFPTASTYYLALNHKVKPFDDPKVRQAVNFGLDKPAIARVFAGEVSPGCSFLPPGLPGFDEALDVEECPWGDPNGKPQLDKAKQMIEEAGAAGAKVTVYGNNDDPTDKVTQALADQLNKMGFKASVKILDGGVYFQTVGNAKTKQEANFANWFQDFPHPYNFFFLVDGASIQPTNNQNFGNVDDPELNKLFNQIRVELDAGKVEQLASEANRKLVEEGHSVPYGHRKLATFFSERMDFENCRIVHPVFINDYTSWCLK